MYGNVKICQMLTYFTRTSVLYRAVNSRDLAIPDQVLLILGPVWVLFLHMQPVGVHFMHGLLWVCYCYHRYCHQQFWRPVCSDGNSVLFVVYLCILGA